MVNIFFTKLVLSGPYFASRLVKNVDDMFFFFLRFMVSDFIDIITDATLISE